jgi:uncharacterized membrane protein YbaN (DUF454 family)
MGGLQALSTQNRVMAIVGAVEAGVALWYFTNGHWLDGIFYAVALACLFVLYLRRKSKSSTGGRRY